MEILLTSNFASMGGSVDVFASRWSTAFLLKLLSHQVNCEYHRLKKNIGVSKDFQAKNWWNIQILTSCLQKMRGAKGSPLGKLSCSLMVNWWVSNLLFCVVFDLLFIHESRKPNRQIQCFECCCFGWTSFFIQRCQYSPKTAEGKISCWSNGWKQQLGARRRCLSTLSLTSRSFPSFGFPWKRRTKEKQNKQKHVDAGI